MPKGIKKVAPITSDTAPQIVRYQYLKAADNPNQVWSLMAKGWVSNTDPGYVAWSTQPWASTQVYATTQALSDFVASMGFGATPNATVSQVDAYRDQRLATGYADATTGKTWQCDPVSQGKWTAIGSSAGFAITMNANPAPTFNCIAADNSTVTLSAADAFALFNQRIMPWVSATILYARTLKDNINAGTPVADVTAGWP